MSIVADNISINAIKESRLPGVDFSKLPFGKIFSDHMFSAEFYNGQWHDVKIVPYEKILVSPSISAIHYGQAIFEGMKAYIQPDGRVGLFRGLENFKRLNISAERMCMPPVPEEIFMGGLRALLNMDRKWAPNDVTGSLYIRPFYFATDETLGVKSSESYRFMIFTCPVGPYFTEPLRCYAETTYARSFEGGPGYAKAAGNYGASFFPLKQAQAKGYHQIIWLDSKEHKYVEESGAMNLMAVIDNVLVTPKLSSSKLAGITRDSVLHIAKHMGIRVEERDLSITEIVEAASKGKVSEMFGCGTAAQIAPIIQLGYNGKDYHLPERNDSLLSYKIGKYLSDVKYGLEKDLWNWMEII